MLTLCDSICIKVVSEKTVLAGVGNELRIFKKDLPVCTLEWKLKEKIHGIDFCNDYLLVFGGREFMLFEYNEDFKLIKKAKISDWIISGKLLDDPNKGILLVTGHSVALLLIFRPEERNIFVLGRSSCADKSTIYCSTIVGRSLHDCAVFAGTALGELIVWKPSFQSDVIPFHQPVLHRISGHNGVIFSIDVNTTFGLVTTSSDDRSVRFYSIVKQSSELESRPESWENVRLSPIRSVYGHGARVFKAEIVEKDNIPYVISAGEDSFICIWNLDGDLIFKKRHHFGATIWDFEYNNHYGILFSTSSNGSVKCFQLDKSFRCAQLEKIETNSLDSEYLAKVRFIKENRMVAVTNNNKLLFKEQCKDWEVIKNSSDCKCTVLETFGNLIAIAGYKRIKLLQVDENGEFTTVVERPILNNVIRSVCFLSECEMLVCGEKEECKYSSDYFKTDVSIKLPKCREPWITSALKHKEYLILSNRQGHVFLYKFENEEVKLKSTLKHVHGNLGVTFMKLENTFRNSFVIRTTGHDSTIKTLKIDEGVDSMSVTFTKSIPVAWVERLCQNPDGSSYAIGFNDNHFVVWSSKQDVVFQISCGGGHRCWDLLLDYEQNSLKLIFIKNKSLYTATTELNPDFNTNFKIPYFAWHIKSCNFIETVHLSDCEKLLVSGGEDNLLKLSKFSLGKSDSFEIAHDIYSHVSSIKDVSIVQIERSYLLFSVGGRAQICISEYITVMDMIEHRISFMLKSSDFDRKYQRNTQEVDFDPETRFMGIVVLPYRNYFDLYLACSDGFVRKFLYKDNEIELCEELFYGRCILHIRIVNCSDKRYLVTAATDGFIVFWDLEGLNGLSMPAFKLQHHESGVNSLDIRLNDDYLLIASGGDDQNVAISKLCIKDNVFLVMFTKKFTFHIAQVNGVKFSQNLNFLYTASVDQCIYEVDLTTWKVIEKISTCVADVKGFDLFNDDYCIVYGWGVQICKL